MNLVATRAWSMLFMPTSLLLAATVVGLWLVLRAWRRGQPPSRCRLGLILCIGGVAGLYLASTPLVATMLAGSLEGDFPPRDPATLTRADAIVVPGGSMSGSAGPDGVLHAGPRSAADRFETAVRAYRAGAAPLLVFGGGTSGVPGTPPEAEWCRDRALAAGVPPEAAVAGNEAKYTSDEAEGIAAMLRERGASRIILCTSAGHMRRALLAYRSRGFEVDPLPCDFGTRGTAERFSWGLLVPRGEGLAQTDRCVKEWLGIAAAGLAGG